MQYNTKKTKLRIPEYGRSVQEMIAQAVTIADDRERQRCAEAIFRVMKNMQPRMRELPDYRHRIWNHIAYISGYRLNVAYPCPITRLGEEAEKPRRMPYPMKRIRQRHYGYYVEELLRRLANMPAGTKRNQLLALTANRMKQNLFNWNRDAMDETKVAGDISRYTDGRVRLDLSSFRFAPVSLLPRQDGHGSNKKKKRKG